MKKLDFYETGSLLNKHEKTFLKRESNKGYSWGSFNDCLDLVKRGFMFADNSIEVFHQTKELRKIAEWMSNTKGKGLALIGSSGRGKTMFLHGVLPHLLMAKGKVPECVKAISMPNKSNKITLIDEVGREDMIFDKQFGKIDRFPTFVDYCVDKSKGLYFSSNITKEQFIERYGQYIFNRIITSCELIIFEGESYVE